MTRHTHRTIFAIVFVGLLIPAALAWSMPAGEFRLVEQTGAVVVTVTGMVTERPPMGGEGITMPAEATLAVMVTDAETKDIRSAASGDYEEVRVLWDNWHPLVKGVVVIHRAEGDEVITVSTRGITKFLGLRYGTWGMAELTIEGYGLGTEAGDRIGFFRLALTSFGSAAFQPAGSATLSLQSHWGNCACSLEGSYAPGSASDLAGLKAGIGTVSGPAGGQEFELSPGGGRVAASLTGWMQEYDPATGEMVMLPARGEISMALPAALKGTGLSYTWTEDAGIGEGYDAQIARMGTLKVTLTVIRPEGEEVQHMSIPGGYLANFSGNKSPGEPTWYTYLSSDYLPRLHVSGPEHGFVSGCMNWSGTGTQPGFSSTGTAWVRFTGFEKLLFLMGPYAMTR